MSYSLFASKKNHVEEIELFSKVNPKGHIHTDLTSFPTYIRTLPVIIVYETKTIIQGHDEVMSFLRDKEEPKKPKSIRIPRSKPVPEKRPETKPTKSIKKVEKPVPEPTVSEDSGLEQKKIAIDAVPTYTVENTVTEKDRSSEEDQKATPPEPVQKPKKRTSRQVSKKSKKEDIQTEVIEL